MTIFRFSLGLCCLVAACGSQPSASKNDLRIEVEGKAIDVNDLARLDEENPNAFQVMFRDYGVDGEIEEITLYDERLNVFHPYVISLRPADMDAADAWAEMELSNFSVERAALLKRGMRVKAKCNGIQHFENGVRFRDCSLL